MIVLEKPTPKHQPPLSASRVERSPELSLPKRALVFIEPRSTEAMPQEIFRKKDHLLYWSPFKGEEFSDRVVQCSQVKGICAFLRTGASYAHFRYILVLVRCYTLKAHSIEGSSSYRPAATRHRTRRRRVGDTRGPRTRRPSPAVAFPWEVPGTPSTFPPVAAGVERGRKISSGGAGRARWRPSPCPLRMSPPRATPSS